MSAGYDHRRIEQKWQKFWLDEKIFAASEESKKEKCYILDMFPYPSSAGLHVGHPLGYTATDIVSRFQRMRGKNVLHPMGWDAFGLPAENYAIKTKVHPEKTTMESITTFRRQIQELGFSYDWSREVNTSSPEYYRWTQWFFGFFYGNNLAYRKKAPVNWCPSCNTVLANEQVIAGHCERCKSEVIQKELEQWFFKIRDFIEDQGITSGLLSGLQKIDWPESTKIAQENWIGRSEGCNVFWKVEEKDLMLSTFTTTVDTLYGVTFAVISPEHPNLLDLTTEDHKKAVQKYIEASRHKSDLERTADNKDKTGVFTGAFLVNPLSGERIPLFVADYVLMSYGTGVVMGVPAHDQRDMDFAKKYELPIVQAIQDKNGSSFVYDEADKYGVIGKIINSGEFTDENILEGRKKIIEKLQSLGMGESKVEYKLRDWLVSRQRYWGAPIPVVYDNQGDHYLLPDDELPVNLPHDVDFMPTGESPLVKSKSFHDPKDLERVEKKLKASGALPADRHIVRRESDTMDTFVCSSWYLFRYMDPRNSDVFASEEMLRKWGPVDLYVGGAEHTVLHLLYARFFTKALHKYGHLEYDEPFLKLRHQGMILGEDGQKMSKSRGNVINPDEIIERYGADTLRCYEMFMGPFDQKKPWSMGGVQGIRRFLDKVWNYFQSWKEDYEADMKANPEKNQKLYNEYKEEEFPIRFNKLLHETIQKVTMDIQEFHFNTALSQLMIFMNEVRKELGEEALGETTGLPIPYLRKFILLLSPFAPHLAEEIWHEILPGSSEGTISYEPWPEYEERYLEEDTVTYAVQVNGKLRGDFSISKNASKEEVLAAAKNVPSAARHLEGKMITKEVFVPGKIAGFVVSES